MSSSPHPTSTPLRVSSRKIASGHHTPPVTLQVDLQNSLSKEIREHTWEFDANRIAKMLSATGEEPLERLADSAHEALRKMNSPSWPTAKMERDWYPPIALFLNNCIDVCNGALRGSESAAAKDPYHSLYDRLKFIVYDKTTEDGVKGAAPVKPDLVGGLDLVPNERVAWCPTNPPKDPPTKQVLFPVEVKADWTPMVNQAATYARCLFSANPSRQFAIVLGFRHVQAELRFLVFHRGGLTGSRSLSVKDEPGQKGILRILLSILDWKSPEDAGFLGFFNEIEMSLLRYKDDKTGVVGRVTEVLHDGLCVLGRASRALLIDYSASKVKEQESRTPISQGPAARTRGRLEAQLKQGDQSHVDPVHEPHRVSVKCPSPSQLVWSSPLDTNGDHTYVAVKHSWCEDGRQKVEADLLAKCKDDFGTPNHYYSFCPKDTRGEQISTARFLPTDNEQLEDFHWAITHPSRIPSRPQCRLLWFHVSKLVGRSLVHAKTPWELFVAIGHAMLGWLSILRKGFLHRDVSIGNTLMLDPPVTMKSFEAQSIEELMTRLSLEYTGDLARYANLLEEVVKKMGSPGECHGFVIDGDMAASLDGYFAPRDTGERSGTYEFMSLGLLNTLRVKQSYLHSPVDDLQSFYFTAQWAAAFNDGASGKKHDGAEIKWFREMIVGEKRSEATYSVRDYLRPGTADIAGYGLFFVHSLAVLSPWLEKLGAMVRDWNDVKIRAEGLGEGMEGYLALNFLISGYRGVGEYFELVHEHRESLQAPV